MRKIVDGNTAASEIAYLFSEVATIYPITPSSPMANSASSSAVSTMWRFQITIHLCGLVRKQGLYLSV